MTCMFPEDFELLLFLFYSKHHVMRRTLSSFENTTEVSYLWPVWAQDTLYTDALPKDQQITGQELGIHTILLGRPCRKWES